MSEFQVLLDDLDQAINGLIENNTPIEYTTICSIRDKLANNHFCKAEKMVTFTTKMIPKLDTMYGSYHKEDYAEFLKLCEEFKTQIAM